MQKQSRWQFYRVRRVLAAMLVMSATQAVALEEPAFTLVARDGSFELRDYAPHLVAETRVEADFDSAGNAAFRRLFDYISGNNRPGQRIDMTAPVTQQSTGVDIQMTAPVSQVADGDAWRIAFLVPQQYTLDTVPQPNDERVNIRAVSAQRMAAWRFSGRWTEQAFAAAEASLRARLAAEGYRAAGPAVTARYNSPFSLPFMRRNEVLIPVVVQQE